MYGKRAKEQNDYLCLVQLMEAKLIWGTITNNVGSVHLGFLKRDGFSV